MKSDLLSFLPTSDAAATKKGPDRLHRYDFEASQGEDGKGRRADLQLSSSVQRMLYRGEMGTEFLRACRCLC